MLFTRHVARYRVTAPDLETRYDLDRVWNRREVDSRRCEGAKASRIRHRLTQFSSDIKSEIHNFLFINKIIVARDFLPNNPRKYGRNKIYQYPDSGSNLEY
jgi:hypothetical protein